MSIDDAPPSGDKSDRHRQTIIPVKSHDLAPMESPIEHRIERSIAILGALMALTAQLKWGSRAGVGAAVGAGLCWLNFRWLRHGATGVIRLGMAQAGAEVVRVPRRLHAKFFGRLGLLLVAVYVILTWLRLPAAAVICGLAAVVPAILLELAYELIHGAHRLNEP